MLGSFFGTELFYITYLPLIFWGYEHWTGRRLIQVTYRNRGKRLICILKIWVITMYIGQVLKEFFQMPRPTSPPAFPMEPNFKVGRNISKQFSTSFRLNSDSHRHTPQLAHPLLLAHSSQFVVLKTPFSPSVSSLPPLLQPGWLSLAFTKVIKLIETLITFFQACIQSSTFSVAQPSRRFTSSSAGDTSAKSTTTFKPFPFHQSFASLLTSSSGGSTPTATVLLEKIQSSFLESALESILLTGSTSNKVRYWSRKSHDDTFQDLTTTISLSQNGTLSSFESSTASS